MLRFITLLLVSADIITVSLFTRISRSLLRALVISRHAAVQFLHRELELHAFIIVIIIISIIIIDLLYAISLFTCRSQ
jgi:hypothetical protein